ncbi:hypothetical protein [Nonomuraea turcica]|uniref:hypothetical protein n=1 Tax=Nonomuraea sp. G32 TaxID=3067274 RepID=UPI00273A99A3|nr:hypothetical protein [Nonomuraea sp. G32]MDP4501007.1 hypothetical protein [Nonomuraea sp. G32]
MNRDLLLRIAGHAHDANDLRLLLDILGLASGQEAPDQYVTSTAGLASMATGANHGTFRAYVAGCRCDECRAKNAAEMRKHRRRAANDPTRADRAGHGKANTYKNHACRCDACKTAYKHWAEDCKARKQAAA